MPSIRIAIIGLGAMGAPIARNLLKHNYHLTVFARRSDATRPLIDAGASAAASPAEAASQSDITISMVTDTRAVEDVALGPNGVVHGARPGSIFIDHSTIEPEGSRRIAATLAAHSIDMLDAPVSGGVQVAESGALSIMVGGDEQVFARARPVLECYGRTIVHVGGHGAGQTTKACNQICTIVNMLGAAEALLLAERSGLDPGKVKDVLMTGFGASRMLELQGPKMIARTFEGKIESRLHHKDIHIVLDLARALGVRLPASEAAAEVLTELQNRGGARQDSAAMFMVLDKVH